MNFGYGTGICSDCYNNEKNFLFYDESYWLNRLYIKLLIKRVPEEIKEYDEIILHETIIEQVIS